MFGLLIKVKNSFHSSNDSRLHSALIKYDSAWKSDFSSPPRSKDMLSIQRHGGKAGTTDSLQRLMSAPRRMLGINSGLNSNLVLASNSHRPIWEFERTAFSSFQASHSPHKLALFIRTHTHTYIICCFIDFKRWHRQGARPRMGSIRAEYRSRAWK